MKVSVVSRILALLLVVLMAASLPALTSCAKENDQGTKDPATQPTDVGNTDPDRLYPSLPSVKYDKAPIHVLEWSANGQTDVGEGWIPWEEIADDNYDGEVLNKAIFNRNSKVEADYDVVISKEYISVDQGYAQKLRASNSTGDDAYQIMTHRSTGIQAMIEEGMLKDLNELKYLEFDKP